MKSAFEIIKETRKIQLPNEYVKILAKKAYDDPDGFCIMDDKEYGNSYRSECLDRGFCHDPEYMLACLQTRAIGQLGKIAIEIYNEMNT